MKAIYTAIVSLGAWAALAYVAMAFITGHLNAGLWNPGQRAVVPLVAFLLTFFTVGSMWSEGAFDEE